MKTPNQRYLKFYLELRRRTRNEKYCIREIRVIRVQNRRYNFIRFLKEDPKTPLRACINEIGWCYATVFRFPKKTPQVQTQE